LRVDDKFGLKKPRSSIHGRDGGNVRRRSEIKGRDKPSWW
jgi:hypothetical protein